MFKNLSAKRALMFIPVFSINWSLISSTRCFRTPKIGIVVTYILPLHILCFMFHFYVSTCWLSILMKAETCNFYVSLLVSMFHTKNTEGEKQKHCGSDSKTLRERESAPSVFWKMKHETKNETLKSYVSLFEMIDIQLLYNKKMKHER